MDSVVKGWAEVQQEQAVVERDKEQLERLIVCIENCEKVHHFVDQKKGNLELVEY